MWRGSQLTRVKDSKLKENPYLKKKIPFFFFLSKSPVEHQVISVSIKSSKDGIQMFLSALCPLTLMHLLGLGGFGHMILWTLCST